MAKLECLCLPVDSPNINSKVLDTALEVSLLEFGSLASPQLGQPGCYLICQCGNR